MNRKAKATLTLLIGLLGMGLLISGCYTQVATMRSDESYSNEYYDQDSTYASTDTARGNVVNNYYFYGYPRHRFYFRFYYPSSYWFDPSYDDWYGGNYYWSSSYWYPDWYWHPWWYYGGYSPGWYYPYGNYYYGGYYGDYNPYYYGTYYGYNKDRSRTRDFGSTRGAGSTRGVSTGGAGFFLQSTIGYGN